MNSLAATIAIFFAFAPAIGGGAKQSNRAEEIIAELTAATRNVTSVRGSVSVITYDDTFDTVSAGNGKFGYFQPRDGYWKVSNTPAMPTEEQNTRKRRQYRHVEYGAEHWQWQDDCFREVDDDNKRVFECSFVAGKGLFSSLFSRIFGTVDRTSPFLPGLPNKSVIEKWKFAVTDESATHIWLHATPNNDSDKKQFASCDLYMQKKPLELEAVQYIPTGSRQRRVLLFSEVELNPSSHEKPDLSNYKCLRDSPVKSKAE